METYDLLVVGGGINGAGIARDAAGRGLSVLLVERDDLAAHTSSWSTKLIHGGLRYLEHYEFRLVAEALAEREVLLQVAPHIIEPLAFVLPHEPHLRPAWMIRAGLFLYDRLGGRMTLPRSFGVAARRRALGRRAEATLHARLRLLRRARRRCATGRAQCTGCAIARRADPRRHAARARAPRWWRLARDARHRGGASEEVSRARAGQRRRPVGEGRARERVHGTGEGGRAAREGQPHRRAARAQRSARVHPAERRQPDRVRHSVPGPLFADRHHRCRRRRLRRPADRQRRDRLSAGACERLSRAPARTQRHRLDVQRRAAAVRRWQRRSVGDNARLRAQGRCA